MKTRNNVQKVAFKAIVIITSIVVMGMSINAQGMTTGFITNDSLDNYVMVYEPKTQGMETSYWASYSVIDFFATETEEMLEIEDWMINENYFSSTAMYLEEEENALELEDWMLDETYFSCEPIKTTDIFKEEMESILELESWMTNDKIWGK